MAYDKIDFLLNECGDTAIEDGDLVRVTGADLIRQLWLTRVRIFVGEWVLDALHGVPYTQEVFAKIASKTRLEEIFRDVSLETPGVLQVLSVEVGDPDIQTRTIAITVEALIDGPEGASPVTFIYDGTLPLGACAELPDADFPLSIDDLRIWLDAQDLGELTYAPPSLDMENKAATGDAVGNVVLEGVSQLGLKRAVLFDASASEKMTLSDTPAIRHGTGEMSAIVVMKNKTKGGSGVEDQGLLALNGVDAASGKEEFYDFSYRHDDATPNSGKLLIKSGRVATPPTTTSQFYNDLSGVDNLAASLTINGATETPALRYKGGDANAVDWDPWTYGQTLSLQGIGADPLFNQGSPGLGANDDSVSFILGNYYQVASSFADFGTDDFVIEFVYNPMWASGTDNFAYNLDATAGWRLYTNTATDVKFQFRVGGVTISVAAPGVSVGERAHVFVCGNRDENSTNGLKVYINGVLSQSANIFTIPGAMDGPGSFAMGAQIGGSFKANVGVDFLATWHRANWHQAGAAGPTEWAAIAQDRFARLTGRHPSIALGSAIPNIATRTYPAYIDKYNEVTSKIDLFYVGEEWLRMAKRKDSAANIVTGYLPEPEIENLIVESEDFGTTWALVDGGDTLTTDDTACPDKREVADALAADTTDGQHGFTIAPTLTAVENVFSCFFKPGDKDWVKLEDSTVANAWCYFDIANGTIGTSGAGAVGLIKGPYYGDFYRCGIKFTGTAAAHTLEVLSAHADNDDTFAGDGSTKNTYFWGAQCEENDKMSSPIITDGGTATRLADELQFEAGANIGGEDNQTGMLMVDVLADDYNMESSKYIAAISDGGAATDEILFYAHETGDVVKLTIADGGVTQVDGVAATDIIDGEKHTVRVTWVLNDSRIYTDGGLEFTDTSCTIPDDLDTLDIGNDLTQGSQFSGLLSNICFFNGPSASVETSVSTVNIANFDSHILQFDIDSAGVVTLWRNGVDKTAAGALTIRKLDGDGFVGVELETSAADALTNYFEGNIGEILVYEHKLTEDERNNLTAFLEAKWGIS
jgi:hypothetical protein